MLKVLWSLDTMRALHHRPVSLLHFNTRSEINNVCHSERLSSDNCHPMLPSHTAFSKIKALEVVFLGCRRCGSAFALMLSVEKQCNNHI